jgi:hypothetical protein
MEHIVDIESVSDEAAAVEDEIMQNSAILAALTAPSYAAHLLRNLADQLDALLVRKQ